MSDEEQSRANITPAVIEDEMKQSYLDYAMSVIVGRALPDVRDGLKPVHRRILYAMNEMGIKHNTPHKKSARIVGEVLGKFHPHGDQAVYDALVRMAQDFSLRYPLIDGQGNWGSIDGDSAAAMRYTEARMNKIAEELLADIDKDTVDFTDNFDGTLKEPVVLPSRIPNLLINGSSGIAVGMATNMPPHNLREIGEALIMLIDNPQASLHDIMEHVKGPDFPTGGIIVGTKGIMAAYHSGRKGRLKVRAVIEEEVSKTNKKMLIIKEIPYMVNKSQLIEQIANAVRDKKIESVTDLRDESDRKGMRIVLELRKDANPAVVMNQLYKHTRCQETFGIINLALVDGEPKILSLKDLLEHHIAHRRIVIRRRTTYDLSKAEARAHILEGLVRALDHIDEIITLIKKAPTVQEAHSSLKSRYGLSDDQSKAILDMRLSRLAALEQEKIRQELEETRKLIADLKAILSDERRILDIIKEEVRLLVEAYGDDRRTMIVEGEDDDIDIEDLIEEEDVVVTMSTAGYMKRTPIDTYKAQRRGGKGIKGAETREEDALEHLFIANTHHYLLVFTNKGKVYWLKVYRIPEAGRYSKGTPIINLVNLSKDERVSAVIPIKQFDNSLYLFMATKNGVVKKTVLEAFSRPRQGGIIALLLDDHDDVVDVKLTDGSKQIMLATAKGMAIKFHERDVRPMGRTSRGVRGIRLAPGDKVIGMIIARDDAVLATITENGYGKRTRISDYRLITRGGKGVRNIVRSPRNGDVVAIKTVSEFDDLMLITAKGIIIRVKAGDISLIGRNTQGVRLMRLHDGDKVVSAAKIVQEENGDLHETSDE